MTSPERSSQARGWGVERGADRAARRDALINRGPQPRVHAAERDARDADAGAVHITPRLEPVEQAHQVPHRVVHERVVVTWPAPLAPEPFVEVFLQRVHQFRAQPPLPPRAHQGAPVSLALPRAVMARIHSNGQKPHFGNPCEMPSLEHLVLTLSSPVQHEDWAQRLSVVALKPHEDHRTVLVNLGLNCHLLQRETEQAHPPLRSPCIDMIMQIRHVVSNRQEVVG
eukprot:2958834-Pleurochrysis_carterae.AAC.4